MGGGTGSQLAAKLTQLAFLCLWFSCLIAGTSPRKSIGARREQVPFSMAIENGELMHECFPKHLRMGTARLKYDNATEEESKKMRMNVERSTADTKKRSPVQSLCRVQSRQSLTTVRLEVLTTSVLDTNVLDANSFIIELVYVSLASSPCR